MAKVWSVRYRKTSFLLVSDVNVHHEEWPQSSMTTVYGRAARDSSAVSRWLRSLHTAMEGFLM